ncbi:MAG: hypothetical protein HQL07_12325 [Nitrospirae bacterium]|nr:hypothetical protein [Magnetococcales bacterium]HAT51190.1 hypothetical protein [Alphaproteobacteria bacterium]
MIDRHIHFTGSLPLWFLAHCSTQPWVGSSVRDRLIAAVFAHDGARHACLTGKRLQNWLKGWFGADHRSNYFRFFEVYDLLHGLVHPPRDADRRLAFREGAEALALGLVGEGVRACELIVGLKPTVEQTVDRIQAIVVGFERCRQRLGHAPSLGLRLTMIRTEHGDSPVMIPELMEGLFLALEKTTSWSPAVVGLDLCGIENPERADSTFRMIALWNQLNETRRRHGRPKLSISVHAGENMADGTTEAHVTFFEQLLNFQVDRIIHGTFLWISPQSLKLDREENRAREAILDAIAKRRWSFDICPTSNLVLTPLARADIPAGLDRLRTRAIDFSVCTDNPAILQTSLVREHELAIHGTSERE